MVDRLAEGRPSRGMAKHIRQEKADSRRQASSLQPGSLISKYNTITEMLTDEEVRSDPQKHAELLIERIWLADRLEIISSSKRKEELDHLLQQLERNMPHIHDWLYEEVRDGLPRIIEIQRRVYPLQIPSRK